MQKKVALSSSSKRSVISGVLFISGTCIGAGMLAAPAVTGLAGFIPAIFANLICWVIMMATGLLFLEAVLWMPQGTNLLSMADRFFGLPGRLLGGGLFLFLYYCLMVAYFSGGAPLFFPFLDKGSGIGLLPNLCFALLFGIIVFAGEYIVDRLNWILMIGLIISYALLIGLGSQQIQLELLTRQQWELGLISLPVLFSAYGYHNIIPTLSTYLDRNRNLLRFVIIVGTAIPFLIYGLWQTLVIGSVPSEVINAAVEAGVPITEALERATGSIFLGTTGAFFASFALITSLLGVSLSMVDFLADGFRWISLGWKRVALCAIVFLPPAFFTAYQPGIFIESLGFAGGIGESILNGLFPIAMVWIGRYQLELSNDPILPGGKPLLILIGIGTLFVMGLELFSF